MFGKPYKEKYNGQRLTKIDYENKYSSLSEKMKINFPGMSIGNDGQLIPTREFQRSKNLREQNELFGMVKEHKSILRPSIEEKRERKQTTFASTLDLVQNLKVISLFVLFRGTDQNQLSNYQESMNIQLLHKKCYLINYQVSFCSK